MQEDWDALAQLIGFSNESHMLKYLYLTERLSLHEIGRKLGVGTTTISRRLNINEIKRRGRGGANNPSRLRLKLHLLDQRRVYFSSPAQLARELNAHISTVWKYRTMGKELANEVLYNNPDGRVEEVGQAIDRALGTPTGDGS